MRSTRPIDSPHVPHGQASVNQGVAIFAQEVTESGTNKQHIIIFLVTVKFGLFLWV
jgi:hypothetical protein